MVGGVDQSDGPLSQVGGEEDNGQRRGDDVRGEADRQG